MKGVLTMPYYVYVHTLKADGRKYFGITCQKPEERWRKGKGYKGSTHIHNAILKYGWDAFYHDVIHICETKAEAYKYEEYYIELYKTNNEKYGFNLQSGGESPKQYWSSIVASASKRKGKKLSDEALEHIRQAAKERDNSVFAHPRSEETKRKISKSHMGIKCSEKAKQRSKEEFSIPVLCVELNKVFPSMKDAGDYFGLSKCTISAVIKGRNKTAAGYHWRIA